MFSGYVLLHIASLNLTPGSRCLRHSVLEDLGIIWCYPKPDPKQANTLLPLGWGGLTVNIHKELLLATPHPSFVPSYLHILVPTCISNYKREADGHRSPGKFTIAETEWGSRNRISNDSSEAGRIVSNWTDTMAQWKPGPHGHPEDRRGLLGTLRSQGL